MRVKIVKAPGYEDEWSGELITYTRSVDGRPLAVIESDGGEWHVIPSGHVREPRGTYDECGCIAPCPDHAPRTVAKQDREYWNDRPWGEQQDQVDYLERSSYDDDPSDWE